MDGLSVPYHLVESTLIFRGNGRYFTFTFHFSMKFLLANSIATFSHVGLFCLPKSHKKDASLIWVNVNGLRSYTC